MDLEREAENDILNSIQNKQELPALYKSDENTFKLLNNLWFDSNEKEYITIIEFLIKIGVSVDIKNKKGNTALHAASKSGKKDCIELLLKHGASIDIKDRYSNTALHFAGINGHKDCLELLLQNGALVDIQNNYGWTVLHYTSRKHHKDCIELLLKYGASRDIKDFFDRTAI